MNFSNETDNGSSALGNAVFLTALIGLYFTTWVNYLLFHSLAEIFSIVVAFSLSMIAWHSRAYLKSPYLSFIGIAYLYIAFLDLLHTLSYKGMPIFTGYDFYANQLWIAARYLESLSLLVAFVYLRRDRSPGLWRLAAAYALITALIVAAVFCWKIFPECFIAGKGLTTFKKTSEYIICIILGVDIYLLHRNRGHFDDKVYRLLLGSLICTIVSELAFTFYVSNYGFSNLVGHYFKIISFYLVYLAIIKTGIESPFELIFRELDAANIQLKAEIRARETTEAAREMLIIELKLALDEIRTLKGIVPICMHCKKIRDDKGYWNQLEKYIHDHSEAELSHSVCPECLKEHYPDYDM